MGGDELGAEVTSKSREDSHFETDQIVWIGFFINFLKSYRLIKNNLAESVYKLRMVDCGDKI